MDVASWISADAAFVSLLGSAFAYYQANLSKKAKADYEGHTKRYNDLEV